jgi:hypothetical protein
MTTRPHPLPILLALAVAGCSPGTPPPKPAASNSPPQAPDAPATRFEPVDLTAEDLADILGVEAWTIRYSGGPVRCWLEIEETGQETMPRRIPEQDSLGKGTSSKEGGQILLWWRRDPSGSGGVLNLDLRGGSSSGYTLGLGPDAFVFGWPSISASFTPQGRRDPIPVVADREVTLMGYQAVEHKPKGQTGEPRRVKLTLKAMFPGQPSGE